MANRVVIGLLLGTLAGIIDVVPMILQGLTWDANLSALAHWIVAGLVIGSSTLPLKGTVKGVIISFVLLIPVGILIGWKEPVSLIPIGIMTIILGALLGYFIDKFGSRLGD